MWFINHLPLFRLKKEDTLNAEEAKLLSKLKKEKLKKDIELQETINKFKERNIGIINTKIRESAAKGRLSVEVYVHQLCWLNSHFQEEIITLIEKIEDHYVSKGFKIDYIHYEKQKYNEFRDRFEISWS